MWTAHKVKDLSRNAPLAANILQYDVIYQDESSDGERSLSYSGLKRGL